MNKLAKKLTTNLITITFLGVCGLSSCTKIIDLDLNTANTKFVIEGEVPQGQKATIKISKTVNFTETNSFPAVNGANVSLSDNAANTEQLTETAAGVYESKRIMGEVGKTYILKITAEGNTFTATCTMPKQVKLMALNPTPSTIIPPGGTSGGYIIFPIFTDPDEWGNSYRFIQSTSTKTDKSILITNDNIGNGQPYSRPIFSRDFELKKGDVVTVEMRCIDKAIYDYFFALNAIEDNGPGGGTTPANPTTNLTGGALGYFSAHTVQRVSAEVK